MSHSIINCRLLLVFRSNFEQVSFKLVQRLSVYLGTYLSFIVYYHLGNCLYNINEKIGELYVCAFRKISVNRMTEICKFTGSILF